MEQLYLFFKKEEPKQIRIEIAKISADPNPFLGPKTEGMSYAEYIKSVEWKNKRKFAIKMRGNRCEECDTEGYLEVHHIHYKTLYHERLNDIEVLCEECHIEADDLRERKAAYRTWALKKYGENWRKYDNRYLQNEFDEWLERKERERNYW